LTALHMFNTSHDSLDASPEELFANIRKLRKIHLACSVLRDLHKGIFTRLDQLLASNLSGIRLNSNRIDKTTFRGLIQLIALDPSYNAPTRIDTRTFRDAFFLRTFDLRNNTINRIDSNTFLPLYNLHTLELSKDRLHKLGAQLFNGSFVLNRLTLSGTRSRPSTRSFRDCSNLKELYLSETEQITVPDAPRNLALLKTLDHGENQSSLYNSSFRNLDQLIGSRSRITYRQTCTWQFMGK
ncbi:Insulin-like growth factor-binding protein complex acid labile subunit, partial [Melipona quadrifasciata]